MSMVINGTSGITFPDGSLQGIGVGRRNLIINGAMVIDQRNGGSSVSMSTGTFCCDRYYGYANQASKLTMQQNGGSVTPPPGFTHYQGITSSSSHSSASSDIFVFVQKVEGYNVSNLEWGTSGAKNATISFWVRSSLTGTFSGHIANSAQNRTYLFTYSISSADTWTYVTVTIPGDTSGTWITNSGTGLRLGFNLGSGSNYLGTAGSWSGSTHYGSSGSVSVVGTSGATWYITGVQLEVGSVATPFEHRSYGEELALCQRYYQVIVSGSNDDEAIGSCFYPNDTIVAYPKVCDMRAAASITNTLTGTFASNGGSSGFSSINWSADRSHWVSTAFAVGSIGQVGHVNISSGTLTADAEL